MVGLSEKLAILFPGIKIGPGLEVFVQGDQSGQRIAVWNRPEPQPTPAEIAAAELPAAKAFAIAANRAECSSRIYARYPTGRQLSALAGLYDTANVAALHDWIALNIAAENAAADLIEAATTVQAVEAVSVSWPV